MNQAVLVTGFLRAAEGQVSSDLGLVPDGLNVDAQVGKLDVGVDVVGARVDFVSVMVGQPAGDLHGGYEAGADDAGGEPDVSQVEWVFHWCLPLGSGSVVSSVPTVMLVWS